MKDVGALRKFEIEAIRLLCGPSLSVEVLEALANFRGIVEYEYTGSGYFLTLQLPDVPGCRSTFSEPFVMGEANGVRCGFVVFIENHALTLECHTWGEIDVPPDFRDQNVVLTLPGMHYIDLTEG